MISDSGGAFISTAFKAVCKRLGIHQEPIKSNKGQSYLNWMETHFNIQRRLFDYQFALTTTPAEFERVHQTFLWRSTIRRHIKDFSKISLNHSIAPGSWARPRAGCIRRRRADPGKFSRALFPRTTNRYGCVTLHSYQFYVEEGLPKTQVLLWVYGEQLRAVLDNVVVAEYHCHYDWRDRKVKDIRDGVFTRRALRHPKAP